MSDWSQQEWAKLVSRRMRRTPGRLNAKFEASCKQEPLPGAKRYLETHLWHAKRFTMIHRYMQVMAPAHAGDGR